MSNAEVLKAYEEGKHRRYNLLFAVNGGAFAIAKLLTAPRNGTGSLPVLGDLDLWQLSLGMVFFSAVMVGDIFTFGQNMRRRLQSLFELPGKLVLISIGLLLCAGWSLVSLGAPGLIMISFSYLLSITIVWFATNDAPRIAELKQLNEETFRAEDKRPIGRKLESWDLFLTHVLAEDFRINRSSHEVEDKIQMIESVRKDNRERQGPIDVAASLVAEYGVVSSVVTVKNDPQKYRNFKVFRRLTSGGWECVYWRADKLIEE